MKQASFYDSRFMSPEALVTWAERRFGYAPTPLLKPHEATIHKNMKVIGFSTEVAEYLKAVEELESSRVAYP